ncbi:glycosyltransferase [Xanthobacter sp. V2C-4]
MQDTGADMTQLPASDIFLDLTCAADLDVSAHVRELARDEGLFADGRYVTVAVPVGLGVQDDEVSRRARIFTDAARALGFAIAGAAERGRALALIIGAWRWRNQTLQSLAAQSESDPMIATLQPRFGDADAQRLFGLVGSGKSTLPAVAAGFLPECYVAPEGLAALQLITPRAVAALTYLGASSLEDAYAELLRGLRRRGYRNLVCNRTIVPWTSTGEPYLLLAEGPLAADAERSANMLLEMPELRLETILSTAFSGEGHPRILLDCRGMPPSMNGTAVCILGFLRGFMLLGDRGVRISVLASGDAARFHALETEFPDFEILHDEPQGHFMAAILLNQPWSVAAIRDLHNVAGLIMFNMLDTIAWDIIYAAVPGLGRTWSVLGQVADVLFFNSAYSRDRYCFRFHPDERVPLVVTHHSMAPAEIIRDTEGTPAEDDPFVLVMGNSYDHKEVANTLSCLAAAFPYTRFVSVGVKDAPAPNVMAMESGHISTARMARLFSDAAVVVFPSHYEGFGLPVGEALAYGKTIVVRESPLWMEIRALSSHPEMIVTFRVEGELVTAVGEALHEPRPTAGSSDAPDLAPEPCWADCARAMLDAIDEAITSFNGRRWLAREAMMASM